MRQGAPDVSNRHTQFSADSLLCSLQGQGPGPHTGSGGGSSGPPANWGGGEARANWMAWSFCTTFKMPLPQCSLCCCQSLAAFQSPDTVLVLMLVVFNCFLDVSVEEGALRTSCPAIFTHQDSSPDVPDCFFVTGPCVKNSVDADATAVISSSPSPLPSPERMAFLNSFYIMHVLMLLLNASMSADNSLVLYALICFC